MVKFTSRLQSHTTRAVRVSFTEIKGKTENEPVGKIMSFAFKDDLERKIRENRD